MDIYQVPPETVKLHRSGSERSIRTQMDRLLKEGQIEPIVVNPDMTLDTDHPDYWHYSVEQVEAAIRLEWDTILVTY